jgi:hypothetical protein
VVKHLPSKCEALRSKPTTATKKKILKFEASLCNSQKKKKKTTSQGHLGCSTLQVSRPSAAGDPRKGTGSRMSSVDCNEWEGGE